MPELEAISVNDGREQAIREFLAKRWDELEVAEHAGYLLFPGEIRRRKKDGAFEAIPVMLRVPRKHEVRKARTDARAWAAEDGLNPQLDPDLFDDLDSLCILSVAVRSTTPPHEPFEPDPKRLERLYDNVSLDALWNQLEAVRKSLDPRPDDIDDTTFLMLVAAIASKRIIDPLAGLGGAGQINFIVRMACRLQNSLDSKS
jgi:hypothetical protein